MTIALLDATHQLLPLAASSGSAPPPVNPMAMFPWGLFIGILVVSLIFNAGCAVVGYYLAKKYEVEPWLGAIAGFFLTWIGILIVFLIGHSQQQSRERRKREQEYAQWWHANYGAQNQQSPYAWPGHNPPAQAPNQPPGPASPPPHNNPTQ